VKFLVSIYYCLCFARQTVNNATIQTLHVTLRATLLLLTVLLLCTVPLHSRNLI